MSITFSLRLSIMSAIPADFLPLLTEALIEDLQTAAQEIGHCRPDADIAAALERFDAIRAPLDATGWGARAEIDLHAHRDVLQRTLAGRLATERDLLADAQRAPRTDSDEEQYQNAYGYILQLEAFMDETGLEIPKAGGRDA